jgi:hypothetical protein
MKTEKTGDPKDGEEHAGGGRFVPVTGTYGTEVVLPGPLTAGPPQPEPAERWTLAPGHRTADEAGRDDALVAAPVEPVGGPPERPAEEPSEPDRT